MPERVMNFHIKQIATRLIWIASAEQMECCATTTEQNNRKVCVIKAYRVCLLPICCICIEKLTHYKKIVLHLGA